MLVLTVISARVAIGILVECIPEALARPASSPDMLGIDRPLTSADAVDAGRVLGIDEDELDRLTSPQRPDRSGQGRSR